jgi:opacity protein-like surface antigen
MVAIVAFALDPRPVATHLCGRVSIMGAAMNVIGKGSVAAIAIAAGVALGASGASAQGFFADSSWYVKGFGGLTVPQDDDFGINLRGVGNVGNVDLQYDPGYVLGIAGGLMATPNIGVELEYAYRNADADVDIDGEGLGNHKAESNAFMLNALYYFTPTGPSSQWQGYAGGGIGAADLNIEEFEADTGGDFDSDYNFAYQLIGGIAYYVNPNVSLNGEARFFGINDQDLENDFLSFKTTYQTFDVLFGVSYHF